MAKLLYIEASPRKARSHSIAVAKAFLDAYVAGHPEDKIDTLDLWDIELPAFDGATIDAKYAVLHGQDQTPEEANAWGRVVQLFERFNAADKYLFSIPMWNFGIPYPLKHFIDIVTQPGLAFSFSPSEGYKGLVTGKPAAVVYSSGGAYGAGSGAESYDLQKPFVQLWLGFIGFTDVHNIVVEPTLADLETVNQAAAAAKEQARRIAHDL